MTNKRIIIVLSVFAVLACFLLVSSLVFKVKTISVVFSSEQTEISEDDVVSKSGIKKGGSIFFVNKNKATAAIEKNVPYAKVDGIVSSFPNKITINVTLREEEFCIKNETSEAISYLICDAELKILRVENVTTAPTGLCEVLEVTPDFTAAGEFLDNGILKSVASYLKLYSFNEAKVKEHFKTITLKDGDILIKTINNNITIKNFAENLQKKVDVAVSAYSKVKDGDEYKYNTVDFVVNNNLEVSQLNG